MRTAEFASPQPEPAGRRTPPVRSARTALGAATPDRVWYVYRDQTLIGHTYFEVPLPYVGRAAGRFHPGPGYTTVLPVFRMFADAARRSDKAAALAEFVRARDGLGLVLLGHDGTPRAGYVEHLSAWQSGVVAIHAVIQDFIAPSA